MRLQAVVFSLGVLIFSGCDPNSVKVEHDRPHEEVHWSYEGKTGPANWGELKEEWELCGEGKAQSPINVPPLADTQQGELPALSFAYRASPLTPYYNGHTIQVDYKPSSYLYLGDEKYHLKQYHFHTPSEHTFNGKHWPMEMHLVHQNPKGDYAVVAIFARTDDGVEKSDVFQGLIEKLGDEAPAAEAEDFNVRQLFLPSNKYMIYDGSLTTPPCTQSVTWILNGAACKLTEEDIEAFSSIMGNNSRPVQPLNGRVVKATGG